MGAQEEALRHDGDVRWTHDLAKQLFHILVDVAKVAAVDQDVPGGLKPVHGQAPGGQIASRHDADIFLREKRLVDDAGIERRETANRHMNLADRKSVVLEKSVPVRFYISVPV